MAYQALYRVWRSQRFDDVVGQDAITQTLKNAISQQKISHAYLFTGPRGTGKTSAAKIFAKAINCPNSRDGEPCNECANCRAITNGQFDDVIEIDAASNNGVDEIRFLTERANYSPTKGKYKVYIIDEVHMLSSGAFNALLKTLEEPRESLVFILATTEPHKIPATIISRTQRFDFKRIDTHAIVGRMQYILEESNQPYEEQALEIIAQAAEGGMRDALSMLDQAISFADGTVTLADVMTVTGSLTYEMMDQLLDHCFQHDAGAALTDLAAILAEGKEARRLLENLLVYCRDLLLYQKAPQLLQQKSGHLTTAFKELSQQLSSQHIFAWIKILNETQNEVRFTNSPTIYLEVCIVKLAEMQTDIVPAPSAVADTSNSEAMLSKDNPVITALKQKVEQMAQEIKQLQTSSVQKQEPVTPKALEKNRNRQQNNLRVPRNQVFQVLKAATKDNLHQTQNVWEDLLASLPITKKAVLRQGQVRAASANGIVVTFDYEIICQKAIADEEMSQLIGNNLSKMIPDYAPQPVYLTSAAWQELRREFVTAQKNGSLLDDDVQDELSKENKQEKKQKTITNEKTPANQPTVDITETGILDDDLLNHLPPEPAEVEDPAQKAVALFGSDVVKVIDD